MQLDDLYQEVILDHYKHPRCQGCLTASNAQALLFNPLCGDQIQLTLATQAESGLQESASAGGAAGEKITDIGFSGHGCSISQASASMMSELCKGKTKAQVRELIARFRELMRGEKTAEQAAELGDAVALEGVRKFSARVKCAMLAWEALEKCLEQQSTQQIQNKPNR